jgi:hypothetical protein
MGARMNTVNKKMFARNKFKIIEEMKGNLTANFNVF